MRSWSTLKYVVIDRFCASGLVKHAFTTRLGGVSTGNYATLNMGFNVGDMPERVLANRLRACLALGIEISYIVAGRQVHGDMVTVVTANHQGRGSKSQEDALSDTDALITAERGLALLSCHADCVPVFLMDPVKRVIGLVHAGWKGTSLRIVEKTIRTMQAVFGTKPAECLAGIGPAIGPCCYEVGEDVIICFQERFTDWRKIVRPAGRDRWYLDLWEANRILLLEAGLDPNLIATADSYCTSCRRDLFFSYRAAGGITGRMAALIMLI